MNTATFTRTAAALVARNDRRAWLHGLARAARPARKAGGGVSERSGENDARLRVGASVLVGSLGVTGTVTGIDDKPPTRGVSVRLHRSVNGLDACYATHRECRVVTRTTPPEASDQ